MSVKTFQNISNSALPAGCFLFTVHKTCPGDDIKLGRLFCYNTIYILI